MVPVSVHKSAHLMEQYGTVWDAAAFILERTRKWPRQGVLSESQVVDQALEFANTGQPSSVMALLGGVVPPDSAFLAPSTESLFVKAGRRGQHISVQAAFRVHLHAVADRRISTELRKFVAERSFSILLIPQLIGSDGKQIVLRLLPRDLRASLAYVLRVLLDEARPYGRQLCFCRLPECDKFFREQPPKRGTGRPRRNYCCDKHMQLAHDQGAASRLREWRADRAADRRARNGAGKT
jgi:hypothetical protein